MKSLDSKTNYCRRGRNSSCFSSVTAIWHTHHPSTRVWEMSLQQTQTPTPLHTHPLERRGFTCVIREGFSKGKTKLLQVLRHLEVHQWEVQPIDADLVFSALFWLAYPLDFCELILILLFHLKYREQFSKKENTAEFKTVLCAKHKALIAVLQFFVWLHIIHHFAPKMTLWVLNHHLYKQCLFLMLIFMLLLLSLECKCKYMTKCFFLLDKENFFCFYILFFVSSTMTKKNNLYLIF